MSSISKTSTRSSSSGFSSIINDQYSSTLSIQTVLDIQRSDINARALFCGEQDCRLNDLRRMTSAIIDLNVIQSTRRPFERVSWTISHPNTDVRDFVARRLNYWMQQTQIACDMAHEDAVFLQEQQGKQIKSLPPPPLSAANFGRRNRTRSSTPESETTPFNSRRDSVPSTPYKHEQPFTGLLARTLSNLDSQNRDSGRIFSPHVDLRRNEDIYTNHAHENVEMTPTDFNQLMESAKWAGALSDTSDNELNENRVCFADTVSVSKLAEMLRNNELKPTSNISEIENILQQSTINVTTREQMRPIDGINYWFIRVILDDHIQFPPGISQDSSEARQLAYQQMIDVCVNKNGIKMKRLIGNRVKVVKGPTKSEEQNRANTEDLDMNATYISMAEISCLSNYQMVH